MNMDSDDRSTLLGTDAYINNYESVPASSSMPMRDGQLKLGILISLAAVITNVAYYVILPVYLTNLTLAGSDLLVLTVTSNLSCVVAFTVLVVIRWCRTRELPGLHPSRYGAVILFGFLTKLHDIIFAFASLPTRTAPNLLGILSAALLPNTIICRFIMLRIGVSIKRLLCASVVLLGIFVSLLPEIFSLGSDQRSESHGVNISTPIHTGVQTKHGDNDTVSEMDKTVVYSWIWPLLIVGSTLLLAISNVILEREIKSSEVSMTTFLFWAEIFKFLSLAVLSWSSLIPKFGTTTDIGEFLTSLGRGLYCSLSTDPSCSGCFEYGISFALTAIGTTAFTVLLTKHAEGAVYSTIIIASSIPLSTLFWTLFVDTALGGIQWQPQFNIDAILASVGLLLIIPATCLYSYISNRESLSSDTNENVTKDR